MIDTADAALYGAALAQLDAYKTQLGPNLRGRFVQIFLALKYHQNVLPTVQSGQFVSTEVLQTLIDDVYAKGSRPPNDSVLALFENGYHARTGLIGIGNATAQNTWRNNFNIQKGVGCYGTPADLLNPAFLAQSRANCPHLQPGPGGGLSGATCQLNPAGGTYRNEDHQKWLRIGAGGYAVVDLTNQANFTPDVAPGGNRLPLLPVILALYHDPIVGLPHAGRQWVDTADFAMDFNFSTSELHAYFDDDPANPHNAAMQTLNAQATQYTRFAALPAPPAPPQPGPAGAGAPPVLPAPVLTGTQVAPPAVNTGWEAEEYVADALRASGWTVNNVRIAPAARLRLLHLAAGRGEVRRCQEFGRPLLGDDDRPRVAAGPVPRCPVRPRHHRGLQPDDRQHHSLGHGPGQLLPVAPDRHDRADHSAQLVDSAHGGYDPDLGRRGGGLRRVRAGRRRW